MPKDKRTYITVAVDMPDHPKLAALSDSQKWKIVEALCYAREYTTDGVIELPVWRKKYTKRDRDAILATGFAVEFKGGAIVSGPAESRQDSNKIREKFLSTTGVELPTDCILFVDYPEHQQTRREVEYSRHIRSSAGKKGGQRSGEVRQQKRSKGEASASANAKQDLKQNEPEVEEEIDSYYVTIPPISPPGGEGDEGAEGFDSPNSPPALIAINGGATEGKPKSRRKPKTAFPDGWQPTREQVTRLSEQFPTVDLRAEFGKFRDHALSNDRRLSDWLAGYRGWLRNAVQYAARNGRQSAQPVNDRGIPLTPAQIKRARAEALKDRPDAEMLRRAGIPLTDRQRANLGMSEPSTVAVIDPDGFEYAATIEPPPAKRSLLSEVLELA